MEESFKKDYSDIIFENDEEINNFIKKVINQIKD